MKHYEFTVTLAGFGNTPEEAWEDVIEGFMEDPGACPDESETKVIEEDEDL